MSGGERGAHPGGRCPPSPPFTPRRPAALRGTPLPWAASPGPRLSMDRALRAATTRPGPGPAGAGSKTLPRCQKRGEKEREAPPPFSEPGTETRGLQNPPGERAAATLQEEMPQLPAREKTSQSRAAGPGHAGRAAGMGSGCQRHRRGSGEQSRVGIRAQGRCPGSVPSPGCLCQHREVSAQPLARTQRHTARLALFGVPVGDVGQGGMWDAG